MVEYVLTDPTAGKPPGTRGGAGLPLIARGHSGLLPPWFTASCLLCQCSATSVRSTPRRPGVIPADCCGSSIATRI